eukprot:TRINITY_DN10832_c0_g1_i1.p1 TRINITY_DN10832_c0_g1~~TRINITY_DN10832_c0_g1_i1.p1  ORF type:complete len:212 (+),score=47.39 TRINITY_DN10832_c0_g1_i1:58-693(+)
MQRGLLLRGSGGGGWLHAGGGVSFRNATTFSSVWATPVLRTTTPMMTSDRFAHSPLSRRYNASSSTHQATAAKASETLQVGKLNHVAIAVPDLEQATILYRDVMGAKVSEPLSLKEHGVTTVFVELDNTKIELLHPLGENSPIANFLAKKPGGGVHHVCFEVEDIEASVKILKERGVKAIDPKPKIGAHGKPVVFLHPKDLHGVLVEIEQK